MPARSLTGRCDLWQPRSRFPRTQGQGEQDRPRILFLNAPVSPLFSRSRAGGLAQSQAYPSSKRGRLWGPTALPPRWLGVKRRLQVTEQC